jgi:hypothetical protein
MDAARLVSPWESHRVLASFAPATAKACVWTSRRARLIAAFEWFANQTYSSGVSTR